MAVPLAKFVTESRLREAALIAERVVDTSPVAKKPKPKQGDRHRLIGTRTCLCGDTFGVTTKRPDKQSCGKRCVGRTRALQEGARRGEASRRLERWQKFVREALNEKRVTVGALVDMCAAAYNVGYRAGQRNRQRSTVPS